MLWLSAILAKFVVTDKVHTEPEDLQVMGRSRVRLSEPFNNAPDDELRKFA